MAITLDGNLGITTPAETVQGALTTTGNTILGDASTDTLNVGNGGLVKDASGNVGIGTSSPKMKLNAEGTYGNPVTSGATPTGIARFSQTTNNVTLDFGVTTGNKVWMQGADKADLSFTYDIAMQPNGGNLLVGTTSASVYNQNSVNGINLLPGTSSSIHVATDPAGSTGNASIILNMRNTPINGAKYIRFFYNGANDIGNISLNGTTAVAYNTSSDYRLKNTIAPMTGALDKVVLLKPVTYKWNADNSDGQGFIAHELAEVVPDCVSGEKDAVDKDGNPQYQGIDTSFLVATLTAAIQEQQALITQLQADVAALKALSA